MDRTGEKAFFPSTISHPVGWIWGKGRGIDGFQGRIFVLFLLTLPQMRNRCCYFKTSPYLNLLLPSPRLICRSVAEGFSLMTLLGRRSEPRHISPFQFPLSLSLSLPTSLSHLPPIPPHCIPAPTTSPTPLQRRSYNACWCSQCLARSLEIHCTPHWGWGRREEMEKEKKWGVKGRERE